MSSTFEGIVSINKKLGRLRLRLSNGMTREYFLTHDVLYLADGQERTDVQIKEEIVKRLRRNPHFTRDFSFERI
jgi:hypothetical protein